MLVSNILVLYINVSVADLSMPRDIAVFTDKVIIEELVIGSNREHSLANNPCDPTLHSRLVHVANARAGRATGHSLVVADKGDLRTSFFGYASSEARVLVAIEVSPLLSDDSNAA